MKLKIAIASILLATGLTGCSSTPDIITSASDVYIYEKDSIAMRLAKIAGIDHNYEDVEVPADYKPDSNLGMGVFHLTTGSLGVGLANGAGLAGGLGSLGLGLLLMPNNDPFDNFGLLTFWPVSENSQEEYAEKIAKPLIYSQWQVESYQLEGIEHRVTYYRKDSARCPSSNSGRKPCTLKFSIKPKTIITGEVLNDQLKTTDFSYDKNYYVYFDAFLGSGISKLTQHDKKLFNNSYLYLPRKNELRSRKHIHRYNQAINIPYFINLSNETALLPLIKKS